MIDSKYMKEAEVSLAIALYFIKSGLATGTVKVSIDGAHVKVKEKVIFDINTYLEENGLTKIDNGSERWQGMYSIHNCSCNLEIHSRPGEGDVVIPLSDSNVIVIESKGGSGDKKGNQEYRMIREAIGQLMTNDYYTERLIPYVAIPYSKKVSSLVEKWSENELIKKSKIGFILVDITGDVNIIDS